MELLVLKSIVLALFAQFADAFLYKTGVWAYLETFAPMPIHKAVKCDFCRSWWLCLALSIIFCDLQIIASITVMATVIKQMLNRNINSL